MPFTLNLHSHFLTYCHTPFSVKFSPLDFYHNHYVVYALFPQQYTDNQAQKIATWNEDTIYKVKPPVAGVVRECEERHGLGVAFLRQLPALAVALAALHRAPRRAGASGPPRFGLSRSLPPLATAVPPRCTPNLRTWRSTSSGMPKFGARGLP